MFVLHLKIHLDGHFSTWMHFMMSIKTAKWQRFGLISWVLFLFFLHFFFLSHVNKLYHFCPEVIFNPDSSESTMQYHANELLPLEDELVVTKVISHLSNIIKDFEKARVVKKEIARFPKSLTHFFPGIFNVIIALLQHACLCIFEVKVIILDSF